MQKQIKSIRILVNASQKSFSTANDEKNCFKKILAQPEIVVVLNRLNYFYQGAELTTAEIQELQKLVREQRKFSLPLVSKDLFEYFYKVCYYDYFSQYSTLYNNCEHVFNPDMFRLFKFLKLNLKREKRYRSLIRNTLKYSISHLDRAYSLSLNK